jgi:MoxR-like ATPase
MNAPQPPASALAATIAHINTLADGTARRLDGSDGQPPSWHLWQTNEVHAITLALASQRPLLVRGEPGTGKSQLARAAAAALKWPLHSATLHARSEAQDLLYQFDAVRRLADAQINCLHHEAAYWQPQALWQALDWDLAHDYGSLRLHRPDGAKPTAPAGHVVLIDEIDKAPSDVPNGLLEVLGARCFEIAAIPLRVSGAAAGAGCAPWPLVIITTNEERELPAAFLRRCMVLTHDMGADIDYEDFLLRHGRAHFGLAREGASEALIDDALLRRAASQLWQDRQHAKAAQLPAPGLAEYLDLLYALHQLAPGQPQAQQAWLNRLNQYAYLKNRIEDGGEDKLRQQANGLRTIEGPLS